MLGTVQFGLDYGIANRGGQPDYRTCRDIVAAALEAGINAFDTAALYGQSEEVLGRVLAELGVGDRVLVVSKSRPIAESGVAPDDIDAFIERSLRESLRNLRLDRLGVFMFHREGDLPFTEALGRMKDKGLAERIGVSVDARAGADRAVATDGIGAVQLPHNMLDRRFSDGPLFDRLEDRGVRLFARSAFLQGLLLMSEEQIPASLRTVVPVRRRLESLAREGGMGVAELCLRYCLSFPQITSVLIGVDSVSQLCENMEAVRRGPLDAGTLERINQCVPDLPDAVVRPSLWGKVK